MTRFEEYERFLQVVELELRPGSGPAAAMWPDIVHDITMTVETYAYEAGANPPDFAIANYATKLKRFREERFGWCVLLAKQGHEYSGKRGRRDIFVDPRETVSRRGWHLSPKDQRKIIIRMAKS